ncbi:MAG: protein translocase subunit SecD [Gammaproteobacteria bacterium]|nr:protein translocase subunit SecD [Gammaproteobacteria bacterium]MCF6229548.1 protein translocase subunit SecD [Gammaproteobacteria bacterium]
MNRYPAWKYLMIAVVVVVGGLYALPNLYGEDPAIQISSNRDEVLDTRFVERVERQLAQAGLAATSMELNKGGLLLRFGNEDNQMTAKDILADNLGNGFIVALNLAPATPEWLKSIGASPMYLGLDLRGGVHFLMEVDTDAAVKQSYERFVSDYRSQLREEKIRYLSIEHYEHKGRAGVAIKLRKLEDREKAREVLRLAYSELEFREIDKEGAALLFTTLSKSAVIEARNMAVQQNITTLRNRVNELGVAEPVIQRQGESRIVVQLPGVQDTARAKEILGATATLEFRMVSDKGSVESAVAGRPVPGAKLYHERGGGPILLRNRVMLTGDRVIDASSGMESDTGSPAVFITLDGKGATIFSDVTRENVGKLMAVVFIEAKSETRTINGEKVKVKRTVEEVISVARIREPLGKRFQISGLDSTKEARDLALLLRAGALAAPIEIVEERTVGPSLGQDNIDQGFMSVVLGFALVLLFMAFWYRGFGLFANIALALNLVLIIAVLSMLQATLTLPGIAGIVLTVGIAVDANVLIFERIREELRSGSATQLAIDAGFNKAFSTIADANITTLIAAVVLFGFGTGPIKGFAITLSIGILTSMFTAIVVTRAAANLTYGGRKINKLSI